MQLTNICNVKPSQSSLYLSMYLGEPWPAGIAVANGDKPADVQLSD